MQPIGVRQAPKPNGRAGWVRIDSVHQGDRQGIKGVYHITCVDASSQWHVEACVQGLSEAYLLPVLKLLLAQFPFVILGFHSDNGSEYINQEVAKMLNTLRIEQTKSRARQSNDNALAESKNQDSKMPLECLVQLDQQGLVKFKPGITLESLLAQAHEKTDLFELFNKPKRRQYH